MTKAKKYIRRDYFSIHCCVVYVFVLTLYNIKLNKTVFRFNTSVESTLISFFFTKTSEGTGTKIVGYGSGRFLSSRVRFWSGRLS